MSKSQTGATRSEVVNLRIQTAARDLIDRAAKAAGKNRSEFMLEASTRAAESVLLDQTFIALDEDQFQAFTRALDQPPAENPQLRELLRTPAPWDK